MQWAAAVSEKFRLLIYFTADTMHNFGFSDANQTFYKYQLIDIQLFNLITMTNVAGKLRSSHDHTVSDHLHCLSYMCGVVQRIHNIAGLCYQACILPLSFSQHQKVHCETCNRRHTGSTCQLISRICSFPAQQRSETVWVVSLCCHSTSNNWQLCPTKGYVWHYEAFPFTLIEIVARRRGLH